jgi:hypothetical protein
MLNTHKISLKTMVVQNQGNIVSDMDGEKVMMSIQKGKYYNLGSVGGAIWEGIHSPITVNQLITSLKKVYDVEYSECQEQVMSFLELLFNEGLIDIGDQSE